MKIESMLIEILVPLISSHPSLELVVKLMKISKLMYKTIISSELVWIILANTMSCSYCFYQMKQSLTLSSLQGATFWYETVKSIESQRKIRRQWGVIFASQVLTNRGKKCIVQRSSPEFPIVSKREHSHRKIHVLNPKRNNFKYQGSHLVHILDTFLLTDSITLLSSINFLRHWHDLTDLPKDIRSDLIAKDRVCYPPLSYGNSPNFPSVVREPKIQRLSGWMELEGPRFPTYTQNYVSDLRREFIEYSCRLPLRHGTMRIDEEDDDDGDGIDRTTNTLSSFTENNEDVYVLHARHPNHSLGSNAGPELSHHLLDNSPERSMKLALDEDTLLTGRRNRNQKFQIAYCPQMISNMVLESMESLFNESHRAPRRGKWRRQIAKILRSIFYGGTHEITQTQNSTDWLLNQMYLSVSGGAPANSVVKWYATFITDLHQTQPESRLVVVAVCFDINGSIAHVSGITSSKSAFKVLGN